MMVLHGMSVPHRRGREGEKERERRQKGEMEKGGRKREILDL